MINGWHEVRLSGPMSGGALLAALVARECEAVVWFRSPHSAINIFNIVDWSPSYIAQLDRIDNLFDAIKDVQSATDLIVVDSLDEFRPAHPQSVLISGDVRRHWFRPLCPILVLNQARVPYPPGGSFWRTHLRTKQTLSSVQVWPNLYSQMCPDGRWLIWQRSICRSCGFQLSGNVYGDPSACPGCGLKPWAGRAPVFRAADYQGERGAPCLVSLLDWPF